MTVGTQETQAVQPVIQQGRWPEMKSGRPMSLGLMLPIAEQNAVANDSPRDGFWDIVAMARLAVEIGFDMLWLPDHFVLKLERHGGQARGVWECWTTTAGVAAARTGYTHRHDGGGDLVPQSRLDRQDGGVDRRDQPAATSCSASAAAGTTTSTACTALPYDHRVDRFEEAMQHHLVPGAHRARHLRRASITRRATRSTSRAVRAGGRAGRRSCSAPNKPRMMRLTALYADAWDADWQDNTEIVARADEARSTRPVWRSVAIRRDWSAPAAASSRWANTPTPGVPSPAAPTIWCGRCTSSPSLACASTGPRPAPATWRRWSGLEK